jgi:hypothetical protein
MTEDLHRRMEYVEGRVKKHDADLYDGNGPNDPSLTVRVDRNERDFARWQEIARKMTWLTVASIIAGIAELIFKHFG